MARPQKRRFPHLDARVLDDPDLLGQTLDELLDYEDFQRFRRRIIRLQHAVERGCDAAAWESYLTLEEVGAARIDTALRAVARWAFEQGKRGR